MSPAETLALPTALLPGAPFLETVRTLPDLMKRAPKPAPGREQGEAGQRGSPRDEAILAEAPNDRAPKPAPGREPGPAQAETGADNFLADLRPSFPDLLSELRALGFRPYLESEDGAEILKCKGPRDPATGLVQHLPERLGAEVREARPALIRALLAERWERRADKLFAHFTAAGLSPDEAERLGYGNLLFEWHTAHTQRAGRQQCAECGQQGVPLMPAGDGNFLCHFRRDCFASYTRRWREEAADALGELGIGPPGGAGMICRWRRFE